ncbi:MULTISPECIES: TetR/AcrR family transcriptional regulator [unclassified Rhodococcus (in: high G+C Gram-positive bacteria)]|uniref:TetR/AcrR family transcriptional regulator n=1 Tax=unclassified Rhodococcus (in: high G+C Gram-positive bacteria) TaxID=192944 RepID=UPI0007BBCAEC|nr:MULTISPECIES: TetR/AcrR family transcriptional regulator [unclassified Rhodococcus (in: high G+C Gram-positive bacteria)]KZF11370.1 TetR family transcriptional regulator [Rhodococcus sp. EPR-147]KZF12302.1 TetR family transcriptional regulator [Rhodococcus sp. EPR-279]OZF49358.1 TetR/AcrR family transcriptional regulator [Rhodococcus sp. 14-1411-2a]
MTNTELGRDDVVRAADALFYARGIQAVGMDELRTAAGISLKRMYSLFPSKTAIVAEVLRGRTRQWNDGIHAEAAVHESPREKLLSIFDFLDHWFREDDFRGCAFINSFGELGATMPEVADAAHQHKKNFIEYVTRLAVEAGCAPTVGLQIALLAEGAQTTAAITELAESAAAAKTAAEVLLDSSAGRANH